MGSLHPRQNGRGTGFNTDSSRRNGSTFCCGQGTTVLHSNLIGTQIDIGSRKQQCSTICHSDSPAADRCALGNLKRARIDFRTTAVHIIGVGQNKLTGTSLD